MKTKIALALGLFLIAESARAFIPPVPDILRAVTEGRRSRRATEIMIRHKVRLKEGVVEIDEKLVTERGRAHVLFTSRQGGSTSGSLDKQVWVLAGDVRIETRSTLFLKYLLASSSDDLLSPLIAEQFVRRDQLMQYKPGYSPHGDPKTWEASTHYMRHPDIKLSRLPGGEAIAVTGFAEGESRKTVYFDVALKGIRRLEWKEGENKTAWEFDAFGTAFKEGLLPGRMGFWQGENEVIASELSIFRGVSDAQAEGLKKQFRGAGQQAPTGAFEEALRVLLSYR